MNKALFFSGCFCIGQILAADEKSSNLRGDLGLGNHPQQIHLKQQQQHHPDGLETTTFTNPGVIHWNKNIESVTSLLELPLKLKSNREGGEASSEAREKNRRKFISYSSSEWELFWLDNVDKLENSQSICEVLLNDQQRFLHDYLKLLCSSRLQPPYSNWCIIDDGSIKLWYNSDNLKDLEITFQRPTDIPEDIHISPSEVITPGLSDSHIASKFVFYDEVKNEHYVEYIEPLVSHLRFPLSKCIVPPDGNEDHKYYDTAFKGWLIPPPPVLRGDRAILIETGSRPWNVDDSNLKFFTKYWKRSGVIFDEIYAFGSKDTSLDFYRALPMELHNITHYRQCTISSKAEDGTKDHPFLPVFIDVNTGTNDYVLFVLDVTSPELELRNIEFILNDPKTRVKELVWEHHISGNYLMKDHWKDEVSSSSLRLSYEYFLRMRQKGIRAHSWV
jgi:hypothetical protein